MHIAQATPTVFLQNPETLVHLYQIFQTLFVKSCICSDAMLHNQFLIRLCPSYTPGSLPSLTAPHLPAYLNL